MNTEELIQSKKGTIVDVRSVAEFNSGHVAESINIPLQLLEEKLEKIKALTQPLILCCASGGRSGQAQHYLSQLGIECYNAGGWSEVEFFQQKTK